MPGTWLALLCALTCSAGVHAAEERVDHGRFGTVTIYHPQGPPTAVVLFLSGDAGWSQGVADMAKLLVAKGALVAGISLPAWQKRLEAADGDCVFPDGDLEELSHFVQASARLPGYLSPYIVGYSSGAAYAYAMLAQAPEDTFAGAISVGFCPAIGLRKRMCKGEDLHFTPRADGKGVALQAGARLRNPWTVLHGESDQVCPLAETQAFVKSTPEATLVTLPKVGHEYPLAANWTPRFLAAFDSMRDQRRAAALPPPPPSLADLPLIEVLAQGPQEDSFAVMLSGDGGWAGMDKQIAAELTSRGIPVAGWDSLRYFWSARTPAGLATDLDRVLRYYADRWKKTRVILIGYSQGADVLSFAVNRLPENTRALLAQSVMIAPGLKATFEFHFGNWFGGSSGGIPIPPEAEKLDAARTLCIYGKDETDSLCPQIAGKSARSVALPGAHHFNGDYQRVAAEILARVREVSAPARNP